MSTYSYLLITLVIVGGIIGFQLSKNDLLRQMFLSYRMSVYLVKAMCGVIVLVILWLQAPRVVLRVIPVVLALVYVGVCSGLRYLFKWKKVYDWNQDRRNEVREAVLYAMISTLFAVGALFLFFLMITDYPGVPLDLGATEIDRTISYALTLSIVSLFLIVLVHYLIVLGQGSGEDDDSGRTMIRLRRKLRSLPRN